MAISGISQAFAAVGAYDSQAQAGDTQNNPLATLQRKEAAAQTQLSAFGQVKSSLADLQVKTAALKSPGKSPTLEDFNTLVQGFVQSFNHLNYTVNAVSSQKLSVLTGDVRPAQALNEIRKAVAGASDASIGALQQLGIDRQKDGTLSINLKTLDQSFQKDSAGALTTLADVASRVGKAIDKQLSTSGAIGKKVQDLSAQVNDLENTRNTLQVRLDSQKILQQRLMAQLANAGGYAARNAVTTYFSVAEL